MTNHKLTALIKQRLILAALSLIAICIALLATAPNGAGISNDAVSYIAAARHIASGLGFTTENGGLMAQWPPLYPALLAIIKIVTGADPLATARIINAALFGLSIYLSGLLFLKHIKQSAFYALVGTAILLISPPLVENSLWMLSECLFIFLTLLYLIFIDSYLAKPSTSSLVLLSTVVAMTCLTRYIGIILIFTGAVSILFFRHDRATTRLKHVFLFVAISALPIGLWVLRNYYYAGSFFGQRASSIYPLTDNLLYAAQTLRHWYLPEAFGRHPVTLLFAGIIIAIFIAGIIKEKSTASIKEFLGKTRSLLLFIVSYTTFLIYSSTTVAYDQISHRLLSPIYIPIAILTTIFLFHCRQLLAKFSQSNFSHSLIKKSWLSQTQIDIALITMIAIWMLYPALLTTTQVRHARNYGEGYNSILWRNSPTLDYIQQHPDITANCFFYSNIPEAVYIRFAVSTEKSPKKTWYNSPDIANTLDDLRGSWPEKNNACLIWFKNTNPTNLFSLHELNAVANLKPIALLQDGAIYSVTQK